MGLDLLASPSLSSIEERGMMTGGPEDPEEVRDRRERAFSWDLERTFS